MTVETITGAQTKATTAETNAKAYIDGLLTGVIRTTARLAATANVNISSPGATFDGTTAANGNRVLLPAQTTGTQNGIYIFNGAASAMTRATDFDTSAEFGHGMLVSVAEGVSNAGTVFELTTADPITLGSTSLTFAAKTGGVAGLALDNSVVHKGDLVLNIKTDLGAVGDGIADDSAAFVAAISAAVASQFGGSGGATYARVRIYIPPGDYLVDARRGDDEPDPRHRFVVSRTQVRGRGPVYVPHHLAAL